MKKKKHKIPAISFAYSTSDKGSSKGAIAPSVHPETLGLSPGRATRLFLSCRLI